MLLDEYEPGATGAEIAEVFDGLADGLNVLMEKIRRGSAPDTAFLEKAYDIDLQNDFGRKIQSFMGYDYQRGRLDLSTHPFTTTLGPDDVRVTTRYDRNQVLSGLLSNIHEAGHGLYEQGIGRNLKGTMLADGTSLGIHESQSRFWENTIGRSEAFWDLLVSRIPGYVSRKSRMEFPHIDFYRAVNLVKPSLIRVEADEVTYSFHIIIRFRLEKALISGELTVKRPSRRPGEMRTGNIWVYTPRTMRSAVCRMFTGLWDSSDIFPPMHLGISMPPSSQEPWRAQLGPVCAADQGTGIRINPQLAEAEHTPPRQGVSPRRALPQGYR